MAEDLDFGNEDMSSDQLIRKLTHANHRLERSEQRLQASESKYRGIMEDSAVCIWDDDWSAAKIELDDLVARGITDFRKYFDDRPEELFQLYDLCVANTVSRGLVRLYGAPSMDALVERWSERVTIAELQGFLDTVVAFWGGATNFAYEAEERKYDESPVFTYSQIAILSDNIRNWSRVIITTLDITDLNRAEAAVLRRAKYQALLANLSADLIKGRADDSSKQIAHGLSRIGESYVLDAISLWWFDESGEVMHSTHRWARAVGGERPDRRSRSEFPWITEHLSQGKIVKVEDIEELPSEALIDREIFRKRGTKSCLIIPLLVDQRLQGSCVFSTLERTRNWSKETTEELSLAAESLAGAYARAQAMAEVQQLKEQLQEENIYLREEVRLAHGFDEIIGEDVVLKQCLMAVEKIGVTDVPVMILGETGTGKELIARSVHKLSDRREKRMITVNCPALPSELIESELFGHEKGAFTGAQSVRHGRFEMANGGTLFLDEIGDLPLELQAKLLRVLQSGEFERLGGIETLYSDVRLIVATNRELKQAVENGSFRADLYYRINNFPICLPALRDRKNDIPLLAEHFARKHAARLGRNVNAISSGMLKELSDYSWPGNIRELESVIERSLISSAGDSVLKLAAPLTEAAVGSGAEAAAAVGEGLTLSSIERTHIVNVLEQTGWMIAGNNGAAAVLGMPPSTLRSRMKRLGISPQKRKIAMAMSS